MDLEIQRWKNLATLSEHHHPSEKVALVRKRRQQMHKPVKRVDNVFSAMPPLRATARQRKAEFSKVLEDISAQQSEEIQRLLEGGDLNVDYMNDILKTEEYINEKLRENRTATAYSGSMFSTRPQTTIAPMTAGSDVSDIDIERFRGLNSAAPIQEEVEGATIGELLEENDMTDVLKTPECTKAPTPVTKKLAKTVNVEPVSKKLETRFMPPVTLENKTKQYLVLKNIKKNLASSTLTEKAQDNQKLDKLEAIHYFLKREIQSLDPQSQGYQEQRIQAFDSMVNQFTSYAPILSMIKTEYDKIIFGKQTDREELTKLRSRVRNLENQNENRLMLDFEKKRREALQLKLEELQATKEDMRKEHRRKICMLASYLPASVLQREINADPALELPEDPNPGEDDPIVTIEKKVTMLETALKQEHAAYDNLKRLQENDFVPKAQKDQLDLAMVDAHQQIENLTKFQTELTKSLNDRSDALRSLEIAFQEKELELNNLKQDYNSVSETLSNLLIKAEQEGKSF